MVIVATIGPAVAADAPQDSLQQVSFCDLAKSPTAYAGKRIRVRGIYRYMFESSRLESSDCCPVNDFHIWVEVKPVLDDRSKRLFRKIDKGMGLGLVIFEGTFAERKTLEPAGDRFELRVDGISRVERTSPSSRQRDNPAWVPRCNSAP